MEEKMYLEVKGLKKSYGENGRKCSGGRRSMLCKDIEKGSAGLKCGMRDKPDFFVADVCRALWGDHCIVFCDKPVVDTEGEPGAAGGGAEKPRVVDA